MDWLQWVATYPVLIHIVVVVLAHYEQPGIYPLSDACFVQIETLNYRYVLGICNNRMSCFSPPFVGDNGVNMTFLLPIHTYNIYLKSILNTPKVGYSQWGQTSIPSTTTSKTVNHHIQYTSIYYVSLIDDVGSATPDKWYMYITSQSEVESFMVISNTKSATANNFRYATIGY